jgi:hypothetical protein
LRFLREGSNVECVRYQELRLGDVISGAAKEVWDIIFGAVTDPGPWAVAFLGVAGVVAVGLIMRGKLASWVLLPVIALLAYWGWVRFRGY